MATFVLVSGAWHAGWCWERVVPLLEAAGHMALAPDLKGMDPADPSAAGIGVLDWADQVANIIREQDESVVLVGHSRGGVVISETAERVPACIDLLVYLAAFILPNEVSLLAMAQRTGGADASALLEYRDDGTASVKADLIIPTFYNTTDKEWADRAQSLLVPEPLSALMHPVAITDDRFGSIRRAYIECLQDNAVTIALQRSMQKDTPCQSVVTLNSDHSPFYSQPEELVAALISLADELQ